MKKNKFKDDTKMLDMFTQHRYPCKCGHKVTIFKEKKKLCTWCGRYVYKDKKMEFKDRLKERGVKCD